MVNAPTTQLDQHLGRLQARFLDQFFLSTKTSALKKEISSARKDYDESLSEYWSRYMSLLDACPNHWMSEAEIYNIFYE